MSSCPAPVPYVEAADGTAPCDRARLGDGLLLPVLLAGVLVLGTVVRFWGLSRPFESSDQAVMPFFVVHNYGLKWLFEHSYGPLPALFYRTVGEAWSRLGLSIDETTFRWPIAIVGAAQVLLTFPLLRRLGRGPYEAAVASLCCAFLPTLVADVRFVWGWGYSSLQLLFGTLALWATLVWMDTRHRWALILAGLALFAHCLCNCYALALPLTLLAAWYQFAAGSKKSRLVDGDPEMRPPRSAFAIGFLLPSLAAATAIVAIWFWTGAGQIGRLMLKTQRGTTGLQFHQLIELPAVWSVHFGYLFGIAAAAGMIYGLLRLAHADRLGLLAVWGWSALLPLVLFVNWKQVGYPAGYFLEVSCAAGLLGVGLLIDCWKHFANRRMAFAALTAVALMHLAVGTGDMVFGRERAARWTGISTGWGLREPDSGAKAAGWYVRQYVPADATILVLHDNKGMEAPVAHYYLGRYVLATQELRVEYLPVLMNAFIDDADVVITEPRDEAVVRDTGRFERVCTLRSGARPVRYLYARKGGAFRPDEIPAGSSVENAGITPRLLPVLDEQIAVLNARYDETWRPRYIPIPLPAGQGFMDHFPRYQAIVETLKSGSRRPWAQ